MTVLKKIILLVIVILLFVGGYYAYVTFSTPHQRIGYTIDRLYWFIETPQDDGCKLAGLYSIEEPDLAISKFEICDDALKDIEFKEGLLSVVTSCGRRYTADLDRNRDFYDNNFCNRGSFEGGLVDERITLDTIKASWEVFEPTISLRPSYSDPAAEPVWRFPSAVQLIGGNRFLVRLEDDTAVHIMLVKFQDEVFTEMYIYENQPAFSIDEWSDITTQYGDPTERMETYALEVMRDGELVIFDELTQVSESENVFLERNYNQ